MFGLFRKKANDFFSAEEKQLITDAIKAAEKQTSGEVRVYIESKCEYVNAIDRALELFQQLAMYQTQQRNAVLVYVAMKDRQLAIFGDEGIHKKVGDTFWQEEVRKMISQFNKEDYAQGIAQIVIDIGHALQHHFPYDDTTDINELSDDIVFGH